MKKHHIAIVVVFATLAILTGLLRAYAAAPPVQEDIAFVSVSGLAFMPVDANTLYRKEPNQQLISVEGGSNLLIAPLILPDQTILTGLTIFGVDLDNQGEVRLRLKQCAHNQASCVVVGETSSGQSYAAGPFETNRLSLPAQPIDNSLYAYFLELELTARSNSGLRSVRLETATTGQQMSSGAVNSWSLSGTTTSFSMPNQGWVQARICTDDLSHLDNPTHYPTLVVDGQSTPLSSESCVTVWGYDIEVRRKMNTGPSSGTYQFLR